MQDTTNDTYGLLPPDVEEFVNGEYGTDDEYAVIRSRSKAFGLPDIAVSDQQARYLSLLVAISGAERILEIGTLGGLSTVAMLRGNPNAAIDTLEFDPHHAEVAVKNFDTLRIPEDSIEVHVGDAEVTLNKLVDEISEGKRPVYDFVFIDADKENNLKYFGYAFGMVRHGGVIMVDNVIREGRCLTVPDKRDFLSAVAHGDGRGVGPSYDSCVIQTVGDKVWDGFVLVRVR